MKYLYIDTSSSFLYTGIVENNKLLAEVKKEYGHNLSEFALQDIVNMMNDLNLTPKDIYKIIVVNGPGSFTGIRIGITIAKIYAWSLNTKITTISSLEAMMLSSKNKTIHVPLIDARRGYTFSAIYDENYNELLPKKHRLLKELEEELKKYEKYSVITNDNYEFKTENYDPDIAKIVNFFKDKEEINPHAVNPEYLKLTEAEESKL